MLKNKLKYALGIATIGLTATTIIWARKQYKKMLGNKITIHSFDITDLTLNKIGIEVFFNYFNNTDIKITLVSQKYDIYLDDKYVASLQNDSTNVIQPNTTSVIGVKGDFNLQKISKNLNINPIKLFLLPKNQRIRIDMKLKVKLLFFNVTIPFSYEDSVKNLTGMK